MILRDFDDDHEDEDWEEDDPDPSDLDECPRCSASIYDDSEQCPHCGYYLTREGRPLGNGKPWWVVAGVIGCLMMVSYWVINFF